MRLVDQRFPRGTSINSIEGHRAVSVEIGDDCCDGGFDLYRCGRAFLGVLENQHNGGVTS
jgi:hypothetical protein